MDGCIQRHATGHCRLDKVFKMSRIIYTISHRRDQFEHEDEGDFGNPACNSSVGGLHGQQTDTQVSLRVQQISYTPFFSLLAL